MFKKLKIMIKKLLKKRYGKIIIYSPPVSCTYAMASTGGWGKRIPIDINKMKSACVHRMSYAKLFDHVADEAESFGNMGYLCPDCRVNAVPYSGNTCSSILMKFTKKM